MRPGIGDLYLALTEGLNARHLTQGVDPRGDHPVFSPDGTEVIFSRWRNGDDGTRWPDLRAAPVAGGPARLLVEQSSGAGFSPDGRWIGYTKHLPGGRGPTQIVADGYNPVWSDDGARVYYSRRRNLRPPQA